MKALETAAVWFVALAITVGPFLLEAWLEGSL